MAQCVFSFAFFISNVFTLQLLACHLLSAVFLSLTFLAAVEVSQQIHSYPLVCIMSNVVETFIYFQVRDQKPTET